jgi:hypothetical protein
MGGTWMRRGAIRLSGAPRWAESTSRCDQNAEESEMSGFRRQFLYASHNILATS